MDAVAMWVGYLVMGSGALCAVGLLLGLACTYSYRKLLKDVPSFIYLQHAVCVYRKRYPPALWAKDFMEFDMPKKVGD